MKTTSQILREQEAQADSDRAAKSNGGQSLVPAQQSTAVAVHGTRSSVDNYLDKVAPASLAGPRIAFTKDGKFVNADSEEAISDERDFVALCGETLVGHIRFNKDAPPDRAMGPLYDGYVVDRDSLGDTDRATWSIGLSGKEEDPWKETTYLVLQDRATQELFTFVTHTKTGLRAVGNLLRHYNRMLKTHPDQVPAVRLKSGGFQHRDERIGWVPVPIFVVCGRAPADSAARPDTSMKAIMDDEIPDFK